MSGVTYHLYGADSVASILAGDWTQKFCDLPSGATGTWDPIDASTARWTPASPEDLLDGFWVVVAEWTGVEGSYGATTAQGQRPPDLDGSGSAGTFGCP